MKTFAHRHFTGFLVGHPDHRQSRRQAAIFHELRVRRVATSASSASRGDDRFGCGLSISAKMLNSASVIARQAVRRFTTSVVRRGGHHDPYDGVPGHNFPFPTKNRHVLLVMMMVYCGSGFSLPFLVVRHQLKK